MTEPVLDVGTPAGGSARVVPVVVNGTGLTLRVRVTGGPPEGLEIGPLDRGEVLVAGAGPVEVVAGDVATGTEVLRRTVEAVALPVVIAADDVRVPAPQPGTATVRNGSGEYVDLFRVEPDGTETRVAALAPDPERVAEVDLGGSGVLVARAAFDAQLLHQQVQPAGGAEPLAVAVTDALRRRAAELPVPSPVPDVPTVQVVGDPQDPPSPRDTQFVHVESRVGATLATFNGRPDVLIRDVRLCGVELVWDAAADQEGTRAYGYPDRVAHDIANLTVEADTVVVGVPLRFPGTNVTVHARVLRFTGPGKIITTPRDHLVARATPATPSTTRPTTPQPYAAAAGRRGEDAGAVTLLAQELVVPPGAVVVEACGGRGQGGEPGGLLDYTKRGPNQPEPSASGAAPPARTPVTQDRSGSASSTST